jgi:Sulfotransferase domain
MRNDRGLILPDFIGIGPGRTGTSWLHSVLADHVNLPFGIKETQYFNQFFDRGIDWYAWHFRRASNARPVGEICPYFIDPSARKRIRETLPDCRFICTFRDPVEHAYSNYTLLRRYVWARGSFDKVLETRPHLDRGNRYASNLAGWFEQFGRDRVLVTWYDDLKADPQGYLDAIADFIGIARFKLPASKPDGRAANSIERAPKSRHLAQNARHVMYWMRRHRCYRSMRLLERAGVWEVCYGRGEIFPRLTPEQEAKVRERYLPEVEALEKLLGCDLSAWKQPRRGALATDHASGIGTAASR